MNLDEIAKQIIQYLDNKSSFIEIVSGPLISNKFELDDNTCIFPLGSIGNGSNIEFGLKILSAFDIPVDQAFIAEANRQGAPFNSVSAVIYKGLSDKEYEKAASGR